ncbi:MAG: SDR family NAD(P)-dependent oxidoreductase, partial [Chloroflexota bacterium]|nr:SDR family NAD(P)-dependent oxidoreductase [Chloroflexota bacterium]
MIDISTFDFNGKVALVTGGSRGIGRAISLAFARLGCTVAFCYRSDHVAAETLCQEAAAHGWQVTPHCVDVSERSAVDALIAAVLTTHGRLDILINNAGIFAKQA